MKLTIMLLILSNALAMNVTNSTEDNKIFDLAELTEERIVGGDEVYPPHKYPFQARRDPKVKSVSNIVLRCTLLLTTMPVEAPSSAPGWS